MDTIWFDLALFLFLMLVSHILIGHFEDHKPRWRRIGKVLLGLALLAAGLHFFGRAWTWGVLVAIVAIGGLVIHGWWLPKHGINGWTGEPRDKYLELVKRGKRSP